MAPTVPRSLMIERRKVSEQCRMSDKPLFHRRVPKTSVFIPEQYGPCMEGRAVGKIGEDRTVQRGFRDWLEAWRGLLH